MKLQITTDAYQSIVTKIGSGIPEKGGILMGKDGIITNFIYDENAHTTGSTYSLNVGFLNPIIKEVKKKVNSYLEFCIAILMVLLNFQILTRNIS